MRAVRIGDVTEQEERQEWDDARREASDGVRRCEAIGFKADKWRVKGVRRQAMVWAVKGQTKDNGMSDQVH